MSHLAINGGSPVRNKPFPLWPQYGEEEKRLLEDVLRSRQWGTLGPRVAEFEKRFAGYIGVGHAQTVCNGTVSLEAILRAMGIGPGDEVIVPPYTFIATATAVLMVGAVPVFADIDPISNNLDPAAAETAISERTKAIIPVHIAGIPADMDRFLALSEKYSIPVIEDAAQAHGSEWKAQKLGSIGKAGSFSFQLSKNLSAGEGGAVTTDDDGLADRIWSVHHIGRKKDGLWYGHYSLSSNFRMTDFQAAILLGQLGRLDQQIGVREENAALLNEEISRVEGLSVFKRDPRATRITHHLYMVRYDAANFGGIPKSRFVDALEAEGIPCHTGYTPIQDQPLFDTPEVRRITNDFDYSRVALPKADKACSETVWILQNALLGSREDTEDILQAIRKIRAHYRELEIAP